MTVGTREDVGGTTPHPSPPPQGGRGFADEARGAPQGQGISAGGDRPQRDGFIQIRVSGTPYEMGLQHGELLRHEIHDLIDAIHHHVLRGQPGAGGWATRRAVRSVAGMMATQVPDRYRRELSGIAQAADVSYRDLLLISCFDDVLANLRLLGAMFGRLGCSAFALTADRTANGELVCGRNLDYFVSSAQGDDPWAATNYMKEHVAVIEFAPTDKPTFVSVGWPGFIGAATALNDRGLMVSSLTVATYGNWPLATPATFTYRRVMEEARTLDEAIAMIRRARRTQGNNVMVGSGDEGTAAVIECTPQRSAVRLPRNGWVAATNHFQHPEMVRRHPRSAFLSSTERLARLGELCGSDGACSAEVAGMSGFLTDLQRRTPGANEYCTVLNPCTVYSTLFAPRQRRLWVRAADCADRSFQEIAWL